MRFGNERSHVRYRAALEGGRWPITWSERLTPEQVHGERVVLGLRLADGVPRAWLEGRQAAVERYLAAGLLAEVGPRVALTPRGVLLSDTVFADLV